LTELIARDILQRYEIEAAALALRNRYPQSQRLGQLKRRRVSAQGVVSRVYIGKRPEDECPMDTKPTTVTKPASFPKIDASRALSEMAEKSATQAKETFEKVSAATTEAADLLKSSCSTALKGLQDYNNKFLEFAHSNSNAAFNFAQKLYGVNSPSEFMKLSTEHTRQQTETLAGQTKELAELAQKVMVAGTKPLQTGIAKAFNQAA
jgi:phasin